MYPEAEKINELIGQAAHIVVVQADNPDMDSLGSSLALEAALGNLGKTVTLYCSVDMPGYLRYMPGWDRIVTELPKQFDLSIFVDVSTYTLLANTEASGQFSWLKSKPAVVLDHHGAVQNRLDFAAVTLIDEHASSTSEIVFNLSGQLGWTIDAEAGEAIMSGILADTQGLTNSLATAATYRAMADLVALGADRPALEEKRRKFNKMPAGIYYYKGKLLERTELHAGGAIATVTVPQGEINEFSPLYNPVALVQGDMLQITGAKVAIVFKTYDDGHVTGAIRANLSYGIAADVAQSLGGGGHNYAAGFKTTGRPFNEVKSECITRATELLDNLNKDTSDETA